MCLPNTEKNNRISSREKPSERLLCKCATPTTEKELSPPVSRHGHPEHGLCKDLKMQACPHGIMWSFRY